MAAAAYVNGPAVGGDDGQGNVAMVMAMVGASERQRCYLEVSSRLEHVVWLFALLAAASYFQSKAVLTLTTSAIEVGILSVELLNLVVGSRDADICWGHPLHAAARGFDPRSLVRGCGVRVQPCASPTRLPGGSHFPARVLRLVDDVLVAGIAMLVMASQVRQAYIQQARSV